VERVVGVDFGAHVPFRRGAAQREQQLLELLQAGRIDARGRFSRRQPFERRANGVDLHEVFDGDLPDHRAAVRRADNEAEQLEIAQRLSYGGLADAKPLRDARLDDAVARRETAVEDVVDQVIADVLAKHAPLQRLTTESLCVHNAF
jgi:hypothetical protein